MSLFDVGSDFTVTDQGSQPSPVPVGASNDSGTNWIGDASVLNNIALGWASLFSNPTATITPTPSGTYVVQPNVPPPAAVGVTGSQVNASTSVLLIGAIALVAVIVLLKK